MGSFALYIHIPFCFSKCAYCDFNSYAVSTIPEKEYVSALLAELDYRASLEEWQGQTVQSIYFGGGTPSLFQPASIFKIISYICRTFHVADTCEITIEANPGTVSTDNLLGFKEAGMNRLSIGAQSFRSQTLKTLGRVHEPKQTVAAVEAARSVGISNLSLDLIYGVPGQSFENFKNDLNDIKQLNPEHISAYGLTIEKDTPLYRQYRKGRIMLLEEDLIVSMMEELHRVLKAANFRRYEISNFALMGKEAKHNLVYWNAQNYLGLGAGAHSFNKNIEHQGQQRAKRWANYALPNRYIKEATSHGQAVSWAENLKKKDLIFEFFFLGLRKTAGISLKDFEKRFGLSVQQAYPALIDVLTFQKLIILKGDRLFLSEKGLMLADSVIANFSDVEATQAKTISPSEEEPPLAANL